jgi:hypothetical protein
MTTELTAHPLKAEAALGLLGLPFVEYGASALLLKLCVHLID